tara:strand:+ start:1528 stop:2721 length:1194 start_codon:yes stop_codon:yes gene_type:complete
MRKVYYVAVKKANIGHGEKISKCIDIDKNYNIYAGTYTRWGDESGVGIDICDKIKNHDNDHFEKNVDLVFRFPDLDLSRDKLSIYQEKAGFKITRNKDKADIAVVSLKFFDKMITKDWSSTCTKDQLLSLLTEASNIDPDCFNLITRVEQEIEDDGVIVISNRTYGHIDNDISNYNATVDWFKELDKIIDTSSVYTCYYTNHDDYLWLESNISKLILDSKLNKLCVEDSVVLSIDDYARLEELLKSNDEDNKNVALTLMANCNVEESKTLLSLAFTFYSENMRHCNVWNQVNFKFLRKEFSNYIDVNPTNWGHAYDIIVKRLVDDKALTLWSSRYIANKMFVGVLQNNFGVGKLDSAFTISSESLVLKDEYKEKLVDLKDESTVISELVMAGDDLPF